MRSLSFTKSTPEAMVLLGNAVYCLTAAIQAFVNAGVKGGHPVVVTPHAGFPAVITPGSKQRPPQVPSTPRPVQHQVPIASSRPARQINFNVRVINPNKKSQYETYVLHDVGRVATPDDLREELLKQFGRTIVSQKLDFSIGYIKTGNKVWIRGVSDIDDVWAFMRKGDSISLWCNGITSSAARDQSSSETESEDDFRPRKPKKKKRKISALEEKNDRVERFSRSFVKNLEQSTTPFNIGYGQKWWMLEHTSE